MAPLGIKRFQNNNNNKVQLQPFEDILHNLWVLATAWLPVQKSRLKLGRSVLESKFFILGWLLIQESRLGLGWSVLESKCLILGWLPIQILNSFTWQDQHQLLDGLIQDWLRALSLSWVGDSGVSNGYCNASHDVGVVGIGFHHSSKAPLIPWSVFILDDNNVVRLQIAPSLGPLGSLLQA